jgi:hypothetical protein
MAFNYLTFSPVGGQSTRGSAPQVFSYVTTENKATIETANYFDGASTYIEANDILKVVYDGGYGEYKVTQVTINGAVTIQSTETLAGLNVITKTADYTATNDDDVILCDATSAAITITLYTAVGNEGQKIDIKKIDSSSNNITIDGNGSETIDRDLTFALVAQDESVTLVSDNSNWFII